MGENNLNSNYSKFILDFISTIRKASFYPAKHPAVYSAIKNLHSMLSQILNVKNTLTLDITQDDKILIGGQVLDVFIRGGLSYFREANIENLTFNAGVTEQELGDLIKILLMDSNEINKAGDIKNLLSDNNIQHIQIGQFSYVKIKKDEEVLTQKLKASELEALKARIKSLSIGERTNQQEIKGIETDIFKIVVAEFKEKKQISPATKNILKKFISYGVDLDAAFNKLKNLLSEQGVAGEEVEIFVNKLKGSISRKAPKAKRIGASGIEELIKTNQELNERIEKLEEELTNKTALLESLKNKAKVIIDEKERIDNIVHSMTDGMVVVDPQGKILMVNPTAETLLGISKQNVGKQVKDIIKDEHLLSLVKDFSADKEVVNKDIELFSPNESTMRVLRASSAVVEDHNGNTVGMVAILNDITKQKEIERLKSDFLAQVSHELRTPLVAMGKSLDLILDKTTGPLSGDQEKFLDITSRNLKRLTALINDLLDLSKFEAGKVVLVREPSSIEKVIEEPLITLKAWADTKTIRLEKNIQPGLPEANIDPNRIIQVLINLMSNAIKFTPAGGTITVEASLQEDKEIKIIVQDTGMGIPPEELTKVFDKFYQVKSSAITDVRGTGIGLTITKEIVELHGGRIWVESEVNKGTKFIFTLPLKAAGS
jgi:two-component system phosphate regulon sensor histidine kinase PhoR